MSTTPYVQQRIHEAALRLFAQQNAQQLSVSELAHAAGVARGTVYNHIGSTTELFDQLVGDLADDMNQQIERINQGISDPALRLANGIRAYVRRAHEEPDWGLFLSSFAFNATVMSALWNSNAADDVLAGISSGRFQIDHDQLASTLALIGSAVIAGIHLAREGLRTWRDAGSDVSEHILRAFGLPPEDARNLSHKPLPALHATRHDQMRNLR